MTLSCNCDMPLSIYCDWLQDQGWDCDELREADDTVLVQSWYGWGNGYGRGVGNGGEGPVLRMYGDGNWNGFGIGIGPIETGDGT